MGDGCRPGNICTCTACPESGRRSTGWATRDSPGAGGDWPRRRKAWYAWYVTVPCPPPPPPPPRPSRRYARVLLAVARWAIGRGGFSRISWACCCSSNKWACCCRRVVVAQSGGGASLMQRRQGWAEGRRRLREGREGGTRGRDEREGREGGTRGRDEREGRRYREAAHGRGGCDERDAAEGE